jgi:hypothetical protein
MARRVLLNPNYAVEEDPEAIARGCEAKAIFLNDDVHVFDSYEDDIE